MKPDIVCKQSAFKHGTIIDDIHSAFSTAVYDVMLRDDREKRLLIGFNAAGNPLEIIYKVLGELDPDISPHIPPHLPFYTTNSGALQIQIAPAITAGKRLLG